MKKVFLTQLILLVSIVLHSQNENPFAKYGYDVLTATSSRGEFTEFHDQTDIVEIGSVLFNTRTNEIIKILDKDETTIDISSATAAMSIDPLCEKYYWISPYTYVANNPIRFIDPDGRKIIGTNGKSVTYSPEKGWSKNTSADTQRIGNSLLKTEKGTERLNVMLSSDVSITMKLSSEMKVENGGLIAGRVNNVKLTVKDGKVNLKSLDLNIYEGSIKDLTNPDGTYYDPMVDGLSVDEAIGAVAGHESEHTETSNIQQQWENQYKQGNHDVEAVPNKTKQEISDELKKQKNQ